MSNALRERLEGNLNPPEEDDSPSEVEALKEEVGKKLEPVAKDDPKGKEEYTFRVEYTNSKGDTFSGIFTNKILTVGEQRKVNLLLARLNDGLPADSIPEDQYITNKVMAHLSFSIKEATQLSPSKWFENVDGLIDSGPMYAVYQEVASHEATFRRPRKTADDS